MLGNDLRGNALAKAWVEALRSGDYRQTQCALRDDNKFCCLGVLCAVAELPYIEDMNGYHFRDVTYPSGKVVPEVNGTIIDSDWWIDRFPNIPEEEMEILWKLNDNEEYTFEQIADEIVLDFGLVAQDG